MATLNIGTAAQFDSSEAGGNSICRLTDSLFVVAFKDVTDSNKGKVVAGTLSGTAITITDDSATEFESGQTSNIEIKRLSDTHFVIAYSDDSDSNYCKGIVGSVSGVTITLGSIVTVKDNASITGTGVAVMDSTYVVFNYAMNDVDDTYGRVASISGTTITLLGSETRVHEGASDGQYGEILKTTTLDSTHYVIAFLYQVDLYAVAVEVDTGTPSLTAGSHLLIVDGTIGNISIDAFDDRYFIMGLYQNIVVGEVEGTTITKGSLTSPESQATQVAVCATDSTHFAAAYFDEIDSDKGKMVVGKHAVKTITVDSGVGITEFEADDTNDLAICRMANGYFVIAYKHA